MQDFADTLLGRTVVADEFGHLEVRRNHVGSVEFHFGLTCVVVHGVAFHISVVIVVGVEDERNGFRFLSFL